MPQACYTPFPSSGYGERNRAYPCAQSWKGVLVGGAAWADRCWAHGTRSEKCDTQMLKEQIIDARTIDKALSRKEKQKRSGEGHVADIISGGETQIVAAITGQ